MIVYSYTILYLYYVVWFVLHMYFPSAVAVPLMKTFYLYPLKTALPQSLFACIVIDKLKDDDYVHPSSGENSGRFPCDFSPNAGKIESASGSLRTPLYLIPEDNWRKTLQHSQQRQKQKAFTLLNDLVNVLVLDTLIRLYTHLQSKW